MQTANHKSCGELKKKLVWNTPFTNLKNRCQSCQNCLSVLTTKKRHSAPRLNWLYYYSGQKKKVREQSLFTGGGCKSENRAHSKFYRPPPTPQKRPEDGMSTKRSIVPRLTFFFLSTVYSAHCTLFLIMTVELIPINAKRTLMSWVVVKPKEGRPARPPFKNKF